MFLNHDFLNPNLILNLNMQRKMGCPELIFEILNFEYNQLDEFLKENGENQASYEKNHFSKTIKGLDGIFSGHTNKALFSINNIDCLKKRRN